MGLIFFLAFLYLILCIVAGNISKEKSGSFASGFWIALLFSPILGIIFALLNDNNLHKSEVTVKTESRERTRSEFRNKVECPNCLEEIDSDSLECRYCKASLKHN